MKKSHILYFLAFTLSSVFSCEMIDESESVNNADGQPMEMTFAATIENEIQSKTALGGNVGDELRKVLWEPGDRIGVCCAETSSDHPIVPFDLIETEDTETGNFKGSIQFSSDYSAFYPYDMAISYYHHSTGEDGFYFELPQTQKYAPGSFDPHCTPMIASNAYGETLQFQNLCGLLSLQLTGTDEIESITFIAFDSNGKAMPVCGTYFSYRNDSDELELATVTTDLLHYSVKLECDEPVRLDPATATPFYIVLPPATYESFTIMITTTDGKTMVKQGTKPLTIKRSDAAYARPFVYVENQGIDLSEVENANCYIVTEAESYSFDATVIGNGEDGLTAGFHTDDINIEPQSVELLWEDRMEIIKGLKLINGKIRFIASGIEGNALIAAKDTEGKILWSWHIWVTDQPQNQVYENSKGTFTMLDRHVGATHNASDDWMSSLGLLYQWGRKDPLAYYITYMHDTNFSWTPFFTTNDSQATIAGAIANPTVFSGCGFRGWSVEDNQVMWSTSKKTIYDPCPAGYRVPQKEVWDGFLLDGYTDQYGITEKYNVTGGWTKGWNFIYDGTNSTYYPSGPHIDNSGYCYLDSRYGKMWSAEYNNERYSYRMSFYYSSDVNSDIQLYGQAGTTEAYFVRCMKDE